MSTANWDPWNYRESVNRDRTATGLVGYKVHATDGDIGKVDEANDEVGSAQIVVDTGPWIFGRKVQGHGHHPPLSHRVVLSQEPLADRHFCWSAGGSDLCAREELNLHALAGTGT